MNLLNVVNWIGVFALAVGSLISVVNGGYVIALFAVLLSSILIPSIIPMSGKFQNVLRGIPRIEMVQRGGRWVGMMGCWVLVGIGGWEYLPAAVVFTLAMIGAVMMMMQEMMMRRRKKTERMMEIESKAVPSLNPSNPSLTTCLNPCDPNLNTCLNTSLTTPIPSSPPQYTNTSSTSTVHVIEEKPANDHQKQQKQQPQVTIKIERPVFNV